jgi:thymidylate synthase (FAD)
MSTLDSIASHPASACVEVLSINGSDARVVNAARVSFAKWIDESKPLTEKDAKLISYLAEHGHDSPFHHPQICLRIKMPIFVAREWYRHTVGFTRNEVSRRYVDSPIQCFAPMILRQRDANIKQGSAATPVIEHEFCADVLKNSMNFSISCYRQLLARGVCPEQARIVLPQSMMTEFIETASLSGYARLCKQRMNTDAQYEIRAYAAAVADILRVHFPVSWAALLKNA